MNQQIKIKLLWALVISTAIVACNQPGKKEAETTMSDTTAIVKTDTEQATALDAVAAAPNLYKILKDSMGIRIIEATYQPGDSSAMHSHADYAVYTVQGGTVTMYGKDGATME